MSSAIAKISNHIAELKQEITALEAERAKLKQDPDLVVEDCCDMIKKAWQQESVSDLTYPLALSPCTLSKGRHYVSSSTFSSLSVPRETSAEPTYVACGQTHCRCLAMASAIIAKSRNENKVPVESITWSEERESWYTRFHIKIASVKTALLIADNAGDGGDDGDEARDLKSLYESLPTRIQKLSEVVLLAGGRPHMKIQLNNLQLVVTKSRDDDRLRTHLCRGEKAIWTEHYPRKGQRIRPENLVEHVEDLRDLA